MILLFRYSCYKHHQYTQKYECAFAHKVFNKSLVPSRRPLANSKFIVQNENEHTSRVIKNYLQKKKKIINTDNIRSLCSDKTTP